MSKKIIQIVIIIIGIVLLILMALYFTDLTRMNNNEPVLFSTWGKKYAPSENNIKTDMKIVTSLEDKIDTDTAWCGTFNLIWNDLKNDLAKQDIIFSEKSEIVDNLNKGTFNTSYLSENDYYKVYGAPSLKLKEEIEREIKKRFNETSNILDDFDFENVGPMDYFLYTMLKKEFEFPRVFTEFENGNFGKYENVKYFGIDSSTDESVRWQVQVLYYNSKDDFGVKLSTKNDEEVVIVKGSNKDTFGDIYNEIAEKRQNYKGGSSLKEIDILKIPNINFNLKEEIKEVENKPFSFSNGNEYVIEKAIQTIEFELDKKGGKIKSEAGMMNKQSGVSMTEKPRNFIVDNTFTIFLKEKGKDLPYFAAKISDISKVQSYVTI